MQFGVSFVTLPPREAAGIGRVLDEIGFESLWLPEHMFFPQRSATPHPYSDDARSPGSRDRDLYDPWIAFAYVAAVTQRIRLGTSVFILPLRHPLAVARSLVTLDNYSGGRVSFGVGVGWQEEEFTWTGQSFHDRGARTDEMIPLLRRLWSEDVVEHHGAHYDLGPLQFNPKPLQQPRIPILVGGTSPAALRRAGTIGDGWLDIGSRDLDELHERITVVDRARRDAGRDHVPFEIAMSVRLVHELDGVRRAADIGVTRVIVPAWNELDEISAAATASWSQRYFDDIVTRFEQDR